MKKKQTYLERLIREEMRRAISEKRLNESWGDTSPRGMLGKDPDWSDDPAQKNQHKPKTSDQKRAANIGPGWSEDDQKAHERRVMIASAIKERGANVKIQGNQQPEWHALYKALKAGDVQAAVEYAQALGADAGPEKDWRGNERPDGKTLADEFEKILRPFG